jgi:hypothetical protein
VTVRERYHAAIPGPTLLAASPRRRVAASPYRRVAASPCRRVAVSPRRRIAVPPPPPPPRRLARRASTNGSPVRQGGGGPGKSPQPHTEAQWADTATPEAVVPSGQIGNSPAIYRWVRDLGYPQVPSGRPMASIVPTGLRHGRASAPTDKSAGYDRGVPTGRVAGPS